MDHSQVLFYHLLLSGNDYLGIDNFLYTQSKVLADDAIQVIECNIKEKWMKVKEKYNQCLDYVNIKLDCLKEHDILDLNDNGMRWEGYSLDGHIYGYGCSYNEDNCLIYEGFIFKGKKVCY